jgi:hypothetical protein
MRYYKMDANIIYTRFYFIFILNVNILQTIEKKIMIEL